MGNGTEAVVLQFKDPVGVVERVLDGRQAHRDNGGGHRELHFIVDLRE